MVFGGSPADLVDKSPATLKVGGEADSLYPVGQVRLQYESCDLCGKAKGSRGGAGVHQFPLLKPLPGRHSSTWWSSAQWLRNLPSERDILY